MLNLTQEQQTEYNRICRSLAWESDAIDALRDPDLMEEEHLKTIADMLHIICYYSNRKKVIRDFRDLWFKWLKEGLFDPSVVEGETE